MTSISIADYPVGSAFRIQIDGEEPMTGILIDDPDDPYYVYVSNGYTVAAEDVAEFAPVYVPWPIGSRVIVTRATYKDGFERAFGISNGTKDVLGTVVEGTFEQRHKYPDSTWVKSDNSPLVLPEAFAGHTLRPAIANQEVTP